MKEKAFEELASRQSKKRSSAALIDEIYIFGDFPCWKGKASLTTVYPRVLVYTDLNKHVCNFFYNKGILLGS